MKNLALLALFTFIVSGCSGQISGEFLDSGSTSPPSSTPDIVTYPSTKAGARISFGQSNPTSATKSMRIDTNHHLEETAGATKSMKISIGKISASSP